MVLFGFYCLWWCRCGVLGDIYIYIFVFDDAMLWWLDGSLV